MLYQSISDFLGLIAISYFFNMVSKEIDANFRFFIKVIIRLNVIDIPFSEPFQSYRFNSLFEIVDGPRDFNYQNCFRF
ncbi:MAG: hypothetical protein A2286_09265 [Gammaproteobacteria bacterium RIFOXYA12_FULL_61_12]|nr:MAG: hypothetical protein A2286_09265 [Gammaproteobacteria bacterium RIFOXYA12_FULL_61_12]OGT88221.1 MAG: hypothetical protein A2514_01135 [Gammaproteobacteria bacterium RIFOXYD12_FULL_61_37]